MPRTILQRLGFLGIILFSMVTPVQATESAAANHLRVKGADLVNQQDQKIILRGFGLGGWIMPEGYMLVLPDPYSSPTRIREAVVDLTDEKFAQKFFKLYERYYVTEKEIAQIKQWGFNSVRIAFNSNRILPPQTHKADEALVLDSSGMDLLDKAVQWAAKHELYVVLDMHGAPGAQSKHKIADAIDGAQLWEKPEIYWPLTIKLWQHLAERYNTNPWVIGYDLLNEPMVPGAEELGGDKQEQHDNTALRELYEKITAGIRSIDHGKKILFVEGGFWANNFKDLTPPWDDNIVYTFHAYPPPLTKEKFPPSVLELHKQGYPIWFGEGGENWNKLKWNEWLEFNTAFLTMLEKETVGWSWWTTKKFSRVTQPWQCHLPERASLIHNYLAGHGPKPSKRTAESILLRYVKNLQTKHCTFVPEVVESLGGTL